jgi:membrane protease YdiL (CAAX protease family)
MIMENHKMTENQIKHEKQMLSEDQIIETDLIQKKEQMMHEKKLARKNMNKTIRGIFLYIIVMITVINTDILIKMVKIYIKITDPVKQAAAINELIVSSENSGVSSIIAIVTGVAILFIYFKHSVSLKMIFTKASRRMNKKSFFIIVAAFMMAQLCFGFIAYGIEDVANIFGYSFMNQIESASLESKTVSMFLYAALFGPIAEELVFRGFLLRSLQPYGRKFAIIMSALMFGLFHGNLPQGIFAMAVGAILGYVAMEYSIVWSIFIHILNNLYAELLNSKVGILSEMSQNIIIYALEGFFLVVGVIIIWKYREKIKLYIKADKIDKKYFSWMFCGMWMIFFIIICVGEMILGITKI